MTEVIEKTEYKKGYKKTKLGLIPEDWKMVRFNELFDEVVNLSNNTETYPLYSLTLENGVTPKTERYERSHLLKDKDENKFKLISKGEIAINPMNLRFGAFFMSKIPETVSLSAYYDIVKAKNNTVNVIFYDAFMKSTLARRLYQRIATGSLDEKKRVHLSELNKQLIPYPKKEEQEKIAEILSAWDDGIETLEKLIEQKEIFHKALMKNLLIGKIRLAEFSKNSEYKKTEFGSIPVDWQIKPLNLLFDKRMQKHSGNTEHNIFTNSATKGVILQNEYFDRSIVTEENTSNYYVVGEDDFMYNPRISQSAPAGPINRNKLGITGIASPLYTIFKAKHDTIIDFYEQYFSSNLWNNSMFIVANQGARHDRLNITSNDFMNMPLPYPPIKEQEKIANILIESYKEIQLLNSMLEKLKDQKKGLMQKLLTGQIRVKV